MIDCEKDKLPGLLISFYSFEALDSDEEKESGDESGQSEVTQL